MAVARIIMNQMDLADHRKTPLLQSLPCGYPVMLKDTMLTKGMMISRKLEIYTVYLMRVRKIV